MSDFATSLFQIYEVGEERSRFNFVELIEERLVLRLKDWFYRAIESGSLHYDWNDGADSDFAIITQYPWDLSGTDQVNVRRGIVVEAQGVTDKHRSIGDSVDKVTWSYPQYHHLEALSSVVELTAFSYIRAEVGQLLSSIFALIKYDPSAFLAGAFSYIGQPQITAIGRLQPQFLPKSQQDFPFVGRIVLPVTVRHDWVTSIENAPELAGFNILTIEEE